MNGTTINGGNDTQEYYVLSARNEFEIPHPHISDKKLIFKKGWFMGTIDSHPFPTPNINSARLYPYVASAKGMRQSYGEKYPIFNEGFEVRMVTVVIEDVPNNKSANQKMEDMYS